MAETEAHMFPMVRCVLDTVIWAISLGRFQPMSDEDQPRLDALKLAEKGELGSAQPQSPSGAAVPDKSSLGKDIDRDSTLGQMRLSTVFGREKITEALDLAKDAMWHELTENKAWDQIYRANILEFNEGPSNIRLGYMELNSLLGEDGKYLDLRLAGFRRRIVHDALQGLVVVRNVLCHPQADRLSSPSVIDDCLARCQWATHVLGHPTLESRIRELRDEVRGAAKRALHEITIFSAFLRLDPDLGSLTELKPQTEDSDESSPTGPRGRVRRRPKTSQQA
ncbi:hypothetical protein B0T26DRAFT_669571 [Lasiosphaeria miniovina]|uniref:Uncharacterized protein n=1 Tax=Lasiosphaeria miniovina TaxID=1954250 RepID=A0AA40BFT0_9PEZI|nr:uncharacterized protein B0T26DRAFT_669571 [Lasiosphaeria miniovina]KAK0733133.1 hypothetical protein B0T26DRAFT_669571 [Lasiosphaeria miniovina]